MGSKAYYRIDLIEKYIEENKISKAEFCRRCKITRECLKKIYNNDLNVRVKKVDRVAQILGIAIYEFVVFC